MATSNSSLVDPGEREERVVRHLVGRVLGAEVLVDGRRAGGVLEDEEAAARVRAVVLISNRRSPDSWP